MKMDDGFIEVNDLDFFASFINGVLAHFATGGRGFVPASIRNSVSDYELVYEYILSLHDDYEFEVVEVNIPTFSTTAQRDRYLKSFVSMAKKGLYSYDVFRDGYRLIAVPRKGRNSSELPARVKMALSALSLASNENTRCINKCSFAK
ncbi:hypothetical protein K3169_17370 [Pseudomonas phytophila]|uniref:Uncharacterized protein n=2 Tax=Pseudomonas phytophila TaxID=2867264 RepID=A0ABY6F8E1_9PSED|nr:hypothetical protein K3169_17370 [Pseudomonas phytophila]